MIAKLYQKNIIEKPKLILFLLIVALLGFGYFSKDFRLDASSDTLLIEGDPDLKYLREITERYGSKDFLLLNNSEAPLAERLKNFVTLKDEGVDKERGFNEILNSPVFRNFVISEDGNTSGIIVNIKKDEKIKNIKDQDELEKYKDLIKKKNHKNILEIREIIKTYSKDAKIFLGGIPMIADDMMSFIKSDIIVFGVGVLLFIIATLWFVFRKLIWIIVPISSCFFSVIIMTGLLGLLNWKVTVISSNFIALMLILTMAMNIHMSTRFLQLKESYPNKNIYGYIKNVLAYSLYCAYYNLCISISNF